MSQVFQPLERLLGVGLVRIGPPNEVKVVNEILLIKWNRGEQTGIHLLLLHLKEFRGFKRPQCLFAILGC